MARQGGRVAVVAAPVIFHGPRPDDVDPAVDAFVGMLPYQVDREYLMQTLLEKINPRPEPRVC